MPSISSVRVAVQDCIAYLNNICPELGLCYANTASSAEVHALFIELEYAKGGAVLRILWKYMTSDHYAIARLTHILVCSIR